MTDEWPGHCRNDRRVVVFIDRAHPLAASVATVRQVLDIRGSRRGSRRRAGQVGHLPEMRELRRQEQLQAPARHGAVMSTRSVDLRDPLNDAISIYFNDATLAAAFVARWCAGYRVENSDGVSDQRGSAVAAHMAGFHKTP